MKGLLISIATIIVILTVLLASFFGEEKLPLPVVDRMSGTLTPQQLVIQVRENCKSNGFGISGSHRGNQYHVVEFFKCPDGTISMLPKIQE